MKKAENRNPCRDGGCGDDGWGRLRRPGAIRLTYPFVEIKKAENRNPCRDGGGVDDGWGRLRRPGAICDHSIVG